jgi:hypothetical protein
VSKIDTSDIPEASEEWFRQARLVLPESAPRYARDYAPEPPTISPRLQEAIKNDLEAGLWERIKIAWFGRPVCLIDEVAPGTTTMSAICLEYGGKIYFVGPSKPA